MDKDFDYEDFKRFMDHLAMDYLETNSSSNKWHEPITVLLDDNFITDGSHHIIVDFNEIEKELNRIDDLESEVSAKPTYDNVDDLLKAVKEL